MMNSPCLPVSAPRMEGQRASLSGGEDSIVVTLLKSRCQLRELTPTNVTEAT